MAGFCPGVAEKTELVELLVCPHRGCEFHVCTSRCAALLEKKRKMYCRGGKEERKKSGEDSDSSVRSEAVVVIPRADCIPRIEAGGGDGGGSPSDISIYVSNLESTADRKEWAFRNVETLFTKCSKGGEGGADYTSCVLYDRYPTPTSATKVKLCDFISYCVTKEGEGKKTLLQAQEKPPGSPLVLMGWNCFRDSEKLRRKVQDLLPSLNDHNVAGATFNLCPAGAIVGLQRAAGTSTNAHSYVSVLSGEIQFVAYCPEEKERIYGSELVADRSFFNPFLPDYETYGMARAVQARVAVLQAGETLVVPSGWWWTGLVLATSTTLAYSDVETAALHSSKENKGEKAVASASDVDIFSDKNIDVKVRAAAARRLGNELFSKRKINKAVEAYSEAIRLLHGSSVDDCLEDSDSDSDIDLDEEAEDEEGESLVALCLCNRAACSLQLGQWRDVIRDCTTALRSGRSSEQIAVKAYYRRAKALEMIGDADGAVNDMKRVLELEPANAAAREAMVSYSSVLHRLLVLNRGDEETRRKQIKGVYTGVPGTYHGS